jgi:hypothetical protein
VFFYCCFSILCHQPRFAFRAQPPAPLPPIILLQLQYIFEHVNAIDLPAPHHALTSGSNCSRKPDRKRQRQLCMKLRASKFGAGPRTFSPATSEHSTQRPSTFCNQHITHQRDVHCLPAGASRSAKPISEHGPCHHRLHLPHAAFTCRTAICTRPTASHPHFPCAPPTQTP